MKKHTQYRFIAVLFIISLFAIFLTSTSHVYLQCNAYDENNDKLSMITVVRNNEKIGILADSGFLLKDTAETVGFIKKGYISLFIQTKKSWKGLFTFFMESNSNFENSEFPISGKIYLNNQKLANSVVFLKSKGKIKQIVTGPDGIFVSSASKTQNNIFYYIDYDTNEWYFTETDLKEDEDNTVFFMQEEKLSLGNKETANQELLNIQLSRAYSFCTIPLLYPFENKMEITFYFSPKDFLSKIKFTPTFYALENEMALYINTLNEIGGNSFSRLKKLISTIQYPQVKIAKSGIAIKDFANKGLKTAVLVNSDGYEYCKLIFENEITIPTTLKDESASLLYSIYPDISYDTVLTDFSLFNHSEVRSIQIIIPIN